MLKQIFKKIFVATQNKKPTQTFIVLNKNKQFRWIEFYGKNLRNLQA